MMLSIGRSHKLKASTLLSLVVLAGNGACGPHVTYSSPVFEFNVGVPESFERDQPAAPAPTHGLLLRQRGSGNNYISLNANHQDPSESDAELIAKTISLPRLGRAGVQDCVLNSVERPFGRQFEMRCRRSESEGRIPVRYLFIYRTAIGEKVTLELSWECDGQRQQSCLSALSGVKKTLTIANLIVFPQ